MLLDHVLRHFWICLLLFISSGSGFPFQVKVPQGMDGEPGLGQFYGGAEHGFYKPSAGQYYHSGGVKADSSGSGGSDSDVPKSNLYYYGVSGGLGSGSSSGGSGSGGSGSDGVGGSGLPFYVVDPQDLDLSQLKLPQFPFPDHWLYPDVPVGTIPEIVQQPPVRVIQNSNDYQRARSVIAHTKYTQDDWDMPFIGDQGQDSQDQGGSKHQYRG